MNKDIKPSSAQEPANEQKDFIIQGLEEGAEAWKAEYDNCRSILAAMVDAYGDKDMLAQAVSFAKQFLKQYTHGYE